MLTPIGIRSCYDEGKRCAETLYDFTSPVNLGNPGEFTIRELAEKVIILTGSRSKLVFKPLPSDDPMQRQPDISCAREKFGWEPAITLEQGLPRTIQYFGNLLRNTVVD